MTSLPTGPARRHLVTVPVSSPKVGSASSGSPPAASTACSPTNARDGQDFVVDVVLEIDLGPAAASDDLADTVDYGGVAAAVVADIEGEPLNLIEALAARIADTCLRLERVTTAEVTVHKPQAPMPVRVADVAVTLVRTSTGRAPRSCTRWRDQMSSPNPYAIDADTLSGMKPLRKVVYSVGSNLGDRLGNLQGAVDAISDTPDIIVVDVSSVYETEPVGVERGHGPFLNLVIVAETTLEPRTLLERAQAIEDAFGRERTGTERWEPRTLDVDLILVGQHGCGRSRTSPFRTRWPTSVDSFWFRGPRSIRRANFPARDRSPTWLLRWAPRESCGATTSSSTATERWRSPGKPPQPPPGTITTTPPVALATAALTGAGCGWLIVIIANAFGLIPPRMPVDRARRPVSRRRAGRCARVHDASARSMSVGSGWTHSGP